MTPAGRTAVLAHPLWIGAADPWADAVAMGLMALVAPTACWFSSRRAMAVDPVTALRTE
jgi:ABC-type lipoprotein release transport system permease subunit